MNSNKNSHYDLEGLGIQTIDVIDSVLTEEEFRGFLKGNLVKYITRKKNQDVQDLEKIIDYASILLALEVARES